MKSWWTFLGKQLEGIDRVLGLDEVGRGPLAGPVCVAGVILPKNHGIRGLKDSKLLTEARRAQLFEKIYQVGEVWVKMESNRKVDKDGIAVCIRRMMMQIAKKAQPAFILSDAEVVNVREIPQMAVVKGDNKVDCIAAASIVAKVTRDRLMVKYDQKYPGYGLAQHKGYGTHQHRQMISTKGSLPIHRQTFLS